MSSVGWGLAPSVLFLNVWHAPAEFNCQKTKRYRYGNGKICREGFGYRGEGQQIEDKRTRNSCGCVDLMAEHHGNFCGHDVTDYTAAHSRRHAEKNTEEAV